MNHTKLLCLFPVDECLYENENCEGSCTNNLEISSVPYMVDANKTALVGVRIEVSIHKLENCTSSKKSLTGWPVCSGTAKSGYCEASIKGIKI